ANFEIGPTITEALACFVCSYVDRVLVDVVNLGEAFDEIDGVAFVASELSPDSMSIDRDPQLCLKDSSHKEAQKAQTRRRYFCAFCALLWPIYFLPAADA